MSKKNTGAPAPTPAELVDDARFGIDFLWRRWKRLLLAFVGVLLPLWGFGALAEELHDGEAFFFDEPLLRLAHDLASHGWDRLFLLSSKLGYEWGVVPFDIALVLVLAALRKRREGLFAGTALVGSALLNLGAKRFFARERPSLWESIAPESTFSFPSGHAMGSMTLAVVLVLLAWRTRWRWWVAVPAVLFAVTVGLSRVYLGVHYPSDILAGWAAATAWVVFVYLLVFAHGERPWRAATG
ncbi:phosphatase PAP2 family protein [Thermomonas sp. HDW16]|uniref:phosphatase PAP2 family protein n=1 Tax=Thermomonas sp. HDW16 TaxID=2714945 RepID=UPI001409053E|nr:phosphatase PAP2 family protein [Thermomonas sp. HDW16]QIL20961.1 phosphatase PAP2 family protein [Thermomonas sp. HDW16]